MYCSLPPRVKIEPVKSTNNYLMCEIVDDNYNVDNTLRISEYCLNNMENFDLVKFKDLQGNILYINKRYIREISLING